MPLSFTDYLLFALIFLNLVQVTLWILRSYGKEDKQATPKTSLPVKTTQTKSSGKNVDHFYDYLDKPAEAV